MIDYELVMSQLNLVLLCLNDNFIYDRETADVLVKNCQEYINSNNNYPIKNLNGRTTR